jgi:hypothetical protein
VLNFSIDVDLFNVVSNYSAASRESGRCILHIPKEVSCGLLPVDIGPGCAYKDVTTAHGGDPNEEENHGIQESNQEAQEGQESTTDKDPGAHYQSGTNAVIGN